MTTPRFTPPVFLLLCTALAASAADWPMFGQNPQRSFASPDNLPDTLHLRWSLQLPRLEPAWLDQPRVRTDAVYHPIIAGNRVIIASSFDDSVAAYDLADARVAWRFITGGPIRYAPAAEKGRLFVGSDDGYLYCLSASTGELLWKLKPAPRHRPVLGNQRIIDTWCIRGGPVVEDGKVYFAAGIWPFMGVFICCADAATGTIIWSNSGDGSNFTKGPHSAMIFSSLAPQGPLAIAGDRLLVPNGRAMPASLDRATGQFQYFNHNNKVGGDRVSAAGALFFDSGQAFDPETGTIVSSLPSTPVFTGTMAYAIGTNEIRSFDLASPDAAPAALLAKGSRRRIPAKKSDLPGVRLGIAAGNRLYTAGDDWIAAVDLPLTNKPRPAWKLPVEGKPADLAAGAGCLLVTTDAGVIHCFGASKAAARVIDLPAAPVPSQIVSDAVKVLLADDAGAGEMTGGYGVAVGSTAEPLARQLLSMGIAHVIAIEPDPARADALRRRLLAERLNGSRIAVIAADFAAAPPPLPPYFASAVVVDESVRPSAAAVNAFYRLLHPYHGAASLPASAGWQEPLAAIARDNPDRARVIATAGRLRLDRRNGLAGAGAWTHENADPANSRCSSDALVKAPLGVLWFGGSSNELILPRHGHGPQPQVVAGRIFIMGMDLLRSLDAYTGRVLWEAPLPGVGSFYNHTSHNPGANGTGSNYVSTPKTVYVAIGKQCVRLDAATGKPLPSLDLPQVPGVTPDCLWSFLCVSGDLLIGGASPPTAGPGAAKQEKDPEDRDDDPQHKHIITNPRTVGSRVLFVMDAITRRVLWSRPAMIGEFRHNATCIAAGKLFTIDRRIATPGPRLLGLVDPADEGPPPRLLCLDLATGRGIWSTREKVFGTWLCVSEKHDTLVEAGRITRDALRDEPKGMRAYKASTGEIRWFDARAKGPIILRDQSLLSEGWGCNLLTGKTLTVSDPITGLDQRWSYYRTNGCNAPAGSDFLLTFRSGAAGYYDLARFGGTGNFGGFRSSCTNNLIIADGLICSPDYTRTCTCSFPIQTSVALIPDPDVEMWTYQGASDTPRSRIKRIGVNLGAPGDRVDDEGTLWLEYPPSPSKSPKVGVTISPEPATPPDPSITWFRQHASTVAGPMPWVTASGALGIRSITVDLKGTHQRQYTVRLYFIHRGDATAVPSVMNIFIEGKQVEKNLNILQAAGAPNRSLVREYKVTAGAKLTIDLEPANNVPTILCGVEAIYEK